MNYTGGLKILVSTVQFCDPPPLFSLENWFKANLTDLKKSFSIIFLVSKVLLLFAYILFVFPAFQQFLYDYSWKSIGIILFLPIAVMLTSLSFIAIALKAQFKIPLMLCSIAINSCVAIISIVIISNWIGETESRKIIYTFLSPNKSHNLILYSHYCGLDECFTYIVKSSKSDLFPKHIYTSEDYHPRFIKWIDNQTLSFQSNDLIIKYNLNSSSEETFNVN